MNFKLTAEQLAKILNYLSVRPWIEVKDLISELSNLEKIDNEPKNE